MPDDIPCEFRPEGTVRFSAGGKPVTLRRVKLAEWRELREAQYVLDDDLIEAIQKMQDANESLPKEGEGSKEEQRAADKDRRRLIREMQEARENLCKGWVLKCFGMLADVQIAEEDLEPWMVTPDFVNRLAVNAQTNPLHRGDS